VFVLTVSDALIFCCCVDVLLLWQVFLCCVVVVVMDFNVHSKAFVSRVESLMDLI